MKRIIFSSSMEDEYVNPVYYNNKLIGFLAGYNTRLSGDGLSVQTSLDYSGVNSARIAKTYKSAKSMAGSGSRRFINIYNGQNLDETYTNCKYYVNEYTGRYHAVDVDEDATYIDLNYDIGVMFLYEAFTETIYDLNQLIDFAFTIDDIPDYDDYNSFLEGYNQLWLNVQQDHDFYDLATKGIGYYFPEYYDTIVNVGEDGIRFKQGDSICYWLDVLPETDRNAILDMSPTMSDFYYNTYQG